MQKQVADLMEQIRIEHEDFSTPGQATGKSGVNSR